MNSEVTRASRVYVSGHTGLAGSAIVRALRKREYSNVIARRHAELDLLDQIAVRRFFETEKPEYVFLAAARVGGIVANNTFPADFLYQNVTIQSNVIHESWRAGVKRLILLGSSCIYPRDCPQPIREEYLLTGPLEVTNRPYAIAKIAGIEQCWSYNRQYGTRYLAVMPTNLYGPGDNYDLQNSHVLPALIRKTHEAKEAKASEVVVWGTGKPLREFLYSDDLGEACAFLLELDETRLAEIVSPEQCPLINVGYGTDLTIADLARKVADVVSFSGSLRYDMSIPDGTPRKLLDSSRLRSLGWRPRVSLDEGIRLAYDDYKHR